MTFSPTGYWAHFSLRYQDHGDPKPTTLETERPRPVLHWNSDGQPVISDEDGRLVTPAQYVARWTEPQPDSVHTGTFEIQPFGEE